MTRIRKGYLSLESAVNSSGYTADDLLAFGEQGDLILYVFVNKAGKEFLNGKLPGQKVLVKGYKRLSELETASLRHSSEGREAIFRGINYFSGDEDLKIYLDNGTERHKSPLYVKFERDLAPYSSARSDGIMISIEQILVRHDDLLKLKSDGDEQEDLQNFLNSLPSELRAAILVFEEFWKDRPQDKNTATEECIDNFIKGQLDGKVSNSALTRIRTIARPEHEKTGALPVFDKLQ